VLIYDVQYSSYYIMNDNEVMPLILLSMNIIKFDVFNYVNNEENL
jgi:hypothetical protein